MNALTAALPAVPPATAPGGAGGAAAAEPDGGFADALQQARQPQPQSPPREPRTERSRESKAAEGRPAAKAEPAAKAPPHARPSEAADASDAGTAADETAAPTVATAADATLPPWLEAALARPAHADPAAAKMASEGAAAAPRAKDTPLAGRAAPMLAATSSAPADPAGATPLPPAHEATTDGPGFAAVLQQVSAEPARAPVAEPALPPLTAAGPAPSAASAAGGPAPAETAERTIAAPLHGPEFAPALGAQLELLVRDGVTEARLHLNPAEMGPISVQIRIDGQTARVEMVAEQAATRQVLEQAMPVLAGALRDSGLTLTGGGVFEQARDRRPGDDGTPGGTPAGQDDPGDGTEAAAERRPAALPQGMVDLYA